MSFTFYLCDKRIFCGIVAFINFKWMLYSKAKRFAGNRIKWESHHRLRTIPLTSIDWREVHMNSADTIHVRYTLGDEYGAKKWLIRKNL